MFHLRITVLVFYTLFEVNGNSSHLIFLCSVIALMKTSSCGLFYFTLFVRVLLFIFEQWIMFSMRSDRCCLSLYKPCIKIVLNSQGTFWKSVGGIVSCCSDWGLHFVSPTVKNCLMFCTILNVLLHIYLQKQKDFLM